MVQVQTSFDYPLPRKRGKGRLKPARLQNLKAALAGRDFTMLYAKSRCLRPVE
jgi:hypothetical protein